MLYGIFVIALIVLIASIIWKVKKKEKKATTALIIISIITMFATAPFIEVDDENVEKEEKTAVKVDNEVDKSEKEREKADKHAEKEKAKAEKKEEKEKDKAEKSAEKAEKKKITKESKKEPEKELTVDEKIENVVYDTIGKKSNTKKVRIHKVEIYGDVANVWLNANENLSTDLTKKGMWKDTFKLIEKAADIAEIELFQIVWMYDFVDKFGNASEGKIMSLDFPRETIDKINFDNVDYNQAPDIADNYWEHGALK